MVKAKIKTKWGSVITLEGLPDEVEEVLSFFQRRESYLNERSIYRPPLHPHEYLSGASNYSPKEEVEKLIESGFLNEFRQLPEIRKKIYDNIKRIIPNSSLHPTLMLLINQGKIMRERLESGLWGYKKREKNE